MKKIVSILLALCLTFALAATAMAGSHHRDSATHLDRQSHRRASCACDNTCRTSDACKAGECECPDACACSLHAKAETGAGKATQGRGNGHHGTHHSR